MLGIYQLLRRMPGRFIDAAKIFGRRFEHHEASNVVQQTREVGLGRQHAGVRNQARDRAGANCHLQRVPPQIPLSRGGRHKHARDRERRDKAGAFPRAESHNGLPDRNDRLRRSAPWGICEAYQSHRESRVLLGDG